MDEVIREDSASTYLARILLNYASGTGVDIDGISEKIMINPSILDNPDNRIPIKQFNAIWIAIVQKVKDKDFGLHVGEKGFSYPAGNILTSMMMNSPNVEYAINKYCRYHNIMADFVVPKMRRRNNLTYLSWETRTTR